MIVSYSVRTPPINKIISDQDSIRHVRNRSLTLLHERSTQDDGEESVLDQHDWLFNRLLANFDGPASKIGDPKQWKSISNPLSYNATSESTLRSRKSLAQHL